mmetsp:Transcript_30972/g.71098  ORF Transcript_30972/g.71098 Transcript_30972/m.71098 type:complete len:383 (-) Transcript_30972:76-1224(-)
MIRALETAIAQQLRDASGTDGSGARVVQGGAAVVGADTSALARRAARQRQRQGEVGAESGGANHPLSPTHALAAALPAVRPPASNGHPDGPSFGRSPFGPSRSAPSESSASEGEVAVLEERLSQTAQRLAASEEALEHATAATRQLAERLADADAQRAALAAQINAQALESDDTWRQAATLRAELLEANDQADLFLHWLSQAKDNLAGGGALSAAASEGEEDAYAGALRGAFELVEAKFLLYLHLVPMQTHQAHSPAAANSSTVLPAARAGRGVHAAFSSLFASAPQSAQRRSKGILRSRSTDVLSPALAESQRQLLHSSVGASGSSSMPAPLCKAASADTRGSGARDEQRSTSTPGRRPGRERSLPTMARIDSMQDPALGV